MSVYAEDLVSTVLVDSGFWTGFNENLVSTALFDDCFHYRLGFDRLGRWLVHIPLEVDRLGR